jgi:hypothetical protein
VPARQNTPIPQAARSAKRVVLHRSDYPAVIFRFRMRKKSDGPIAEGKTEIPEPMARTSRDVRLESGMRIKGDVAARPRMSDLYDVLAIERHNFIDGSAETDKSRDD